MAIWIQSLSLTLIYALVQGMLVYSCIWLILKIAPSLTANQKYCLSVSGIFAMLLLFIKTWWQQYHSLSVYNGEVYSTLNSNPTAHLLHHIGAGNNSNAIMNAISYLQFTFPWITGLYIAGLVFMLARLTTGMFLVSSLKRKGTSQPAQSLSEQFEKIKRQLGITTEVKILMSVKANVPMLAGALKPVILLPMATLAQLTTIQLETILIHELAHLKRHDYIVNILQSISETILFFNPFVWLLSSICRREREQACDDIVLQHTTVPLSYASALAIIATRHTTHPSAAIAASGKETHLLNRIKRIMETKPAQTTHSRIAAIVLIIGIATCTLAWLPPTDKQKTDIKALANQDTTVQSEEDQLIGRLIHDQLINEINGFTVDKKQNELFIDGKKQPATVAEKYMSGLNKENINVQVYPFMDRLNMHPKSSFIQIMFPVSFSSPCVKTTHKKPGC